MEAVITCMSVKLFEAYVSFVVHHCAACLDVLSCVMMEEEC